MRSAMHVSVRLVLILVSLVLAVWCRRGSHRRGTSIRPDPSPEQRLASRLLRTYSRYGRPVANVSQALRVNVSFHMTHLMGMEERDQVVTLFGFLKARWTDEFLRWRPEEYDGVNRLVLPPKLVWKPDFGVENSVHAIYEELFCRRFHVVVTHDGTVTWMPGGKFMVSCSLDVTFYPFDDQVCSLDVLDWAYHGLMVDLHNASRTVSLDAYKESGEWTILSTRADRSSLDTYSVPYPRISFILHLRRKPLFYVLNIVTPTSTITMLAFLVFYVPAETGVKVSLGVSVVLSYSVFLVLVAENVPKTSEVVPLLVIYITLVMSMTAGSVLVNVSVLHYRHRNPNRPVPCWLRRLTFRIMAPMFCIRATHGIFEWPDEKSETEVIHICEERPESMRTSGSGSGAGFSRRQTKLDRATSEVLIGLTEIIARLQDITCILQDKHEDSLSTREWKVVARVFDRFFLVVFLLGAISGLTYVLYIYPSKGKMI